jgi:hypothetical protein
LEVRNLPANVTAPKASIAMGQPAAEIEVSAAAEAPVADKADINVLGTAPAASNQQNASPNFTISVQAAAPTYELKAEGVPLKLKQGDKAKLKVTAVRKGYQGPITVELKNLPANVTAPKATIAQDQTSVEIEVTAADAAAEGDKADVSLSGVGNAPVDKPVASPNFTVSILKK